MLLAIDAGNTNIVFAVYDGEDRKAIWRCKTDATRTADEYVAFLTQLCGLSGIDFKSIDNVIVSSVVPDINFPIRLMAFQAFGKKAKFIGKEIKDVGLKVKLEKPEEIGADRLANSIAVLKYYQAPAVVVGFGTATTFDVIDKSGAFCGGVIAPGVKLSISALHMAAAKLPKVSVSRPKKVIGTNTVTAMQSGIYWGYVGLVESMIQRISAEMKVKPLILATGGLAPLFKSDIPSIDKIDEELTLRGLLTIYKSHKKK
jgi:type III pantothenate kinase